MLGKPSIRRAFSLGISLSAASSLIGACGGDDEGQINLAKLSQGCSLNSQCENPLVCTYAHCHRQCDDDRDCRGEERCVKGGSGHVCQLPADTACTSKSDCNGEQVCGVDKECRDKCTSDADCTTSSRGADQICAQSGECASKDPNKDKVDDSGNITPDPFDDTKDSGAGGASGAGGSGASGGAGGSSGSDGSGGTGTMGAAGVDAGPDSSAGGSAGAAGTGGTAGAAGTNGASGTAGVAGASGTGGTAGSPTDGGMDAGCPTGYAECDGNPNTPCETSLALPTSCGGCTTSCNPQNGTVHCDAVTYRCVVDTCATGYDNCDNDGSNGCESRLTDNPSHCGQCGRSCGGGTCTTSVCSAAIVMDPGGPGTSSTFYELKLVGNRIVASVLLGGEYQLRTVTLPPTTPPSEGTVLHPFASASARQDETLAADATHVYWSTNATPYTVYRKPIDNPSANIEPMFNAPSGGYIYELFLGTAFYYWGYNTTGYGFFTAAKTPGTSAQAITGLVGPPAMYNTSNVGGFVVAGSNLFYASYNQTDTEHQLFTAPAGGGAPTTLDDTIQNYSYVGVVSDGTYVYWNTYAADGRIRRVAVATPTTANIQNVALQISYPDVGLAVDATHVYYMDNAGSVWRAPKDGSSIPQRVLQRSGSIYLVSIAAADANYLYGNAPNGAIVRVSKTP
jgi:hypothetical protein